MPIGEMLDYVRIINDDNRKTQKEMDSNERQSVQKSINDVKMAGTMITTL